MFGPPVSSIAPSDVPARVAQGWVLLDVRTDEEWATGHIAGSVHIPMDRLLDRIDEVEERVICVCAVGARSARVTQYLSRHGRQAVNLDGGVYGWADEGRPLQT